MRAFLAAVITSGCSFQLAGAPASDDAGPPPDMASEGTTDATVDGALDATIDAMIDAPVDVTCNVGVTSQTGTDRGRVGGSGGGVNFPALICPATQRVVGVAVRMSNQNTIYNGRSAHGLTIACATVTTRSISAPQVGPLTTFELLGNGNFMWTPSTQTAVTQCQPGWVVSGLRAARGADNNRFLNVTIRCSQVSSTGMTGATETRYVTGSFTDTNVDTVDCAAGEVLVRMPNFSGAGVDSVNLWCAPATCL